MPIGAVSHTTIDRRIHTAVASPAMMQVMRCDSNCRKYYKKSFSPKIVLRVSNENGIDS